MTVEFNGLVRGVVDARLRINVVRSTENTPVLCLHNTFHAASACRNLGEFVYARTVAFAMFRVPFPHRTSHLGTCADS